MLSKAVICFTQYFPPPLLLRKEGLLSTTISAPITVKAYATPTPGKFRTKIKHAHCNSENECTTYPKWFEVCKRILNVNAKHPGSRRWTIFEFFFYSYSFYSFFYLLQLQAERPTIQTCGLLGCSWHNGFLLFSCG
jgi:hypothetical protein